MPDVEINIEKIDIKHYLNATVFNSVTVSSSSKRFALEINGLQVMGFDFINS